MSKYKIMFIDEEQDTFDDFNDYVESSPLNDKITVITKYPLATLEEMVELIFKLNPDAIVSDHMLNDIKTDIDYNVPYTGVDLVEEFLEIREDFPCFVLTSFDDLAVSKSEDVNKVYIKNILHSNINKEESKAKAKFLDKVLAQIDHYKTRIKIAQGDLNRLLELKKSGKAKYEDEKEIIKLDNFLENSIDKRNAIGDFEGLSNSDRLSQLLNKVDNLIDKIEDKK